MPPTWGVEGVDSENCFRRFGKRRLFLGVEAEPFGAAVGASSAVSSTSASSTSLPYAWIGRGGGRGNGGSSVAIDDLEVWYSKRFVERTGWWLAMD